MGEDRITYVTEGQKVEATLTFEKVEHTAIAVRCSNRGGWFCVTHDVHLQHNLARSSHCGDGRKHLLAWNCFTHGLEVP